MLISIWSCKFMSTLVLHLTNKSKHIHPRKLTCHLKINQITLVQMHFLFHCSLFRGRIHSFVFGRYSISTRLLQKTIWQIQWPSYWVCNQHNPTEVPETSHLGKLAHVIWWISHDLHQANDIHIYDICKLINKKSYTWTHTNKQERYWWQNRLAHLYMLEHMLFLYTHPRLVVSEAVVLSPNSVGP